MPLAEPAPRLHLPSPVPRPSASCSSGGRGNRCPGRLEAVGQGFGEAGRMRVRWFSLRGPTNINHCQTLLVSSEASAKSPRRAPGTVTSMLAVAPAARLGRSHVVSSACVRAMRGCGNFGCASRYADLRCPAWHLAAATSGSSRAPSARGCIRATSRLGRSWMRTFTGTGTSSRRRSKRA